MNMLFIATKILIKTRTRDWFKIRSDRGNDKKSREEIKIVNV